MHNILSFYYLFIYFKKKVQQDEKLVTVVQFASIQHSATLLGSKQFSLHTMSSIRLLGWLNFPRVALLKHTLWWNGSMWWAIILQWKIWFAAKSPNLCNFSISSSWDRSALNCFKKQPKTLFWRALKVWHCKAYINYKYHSAVHFHFSQSVIYELQRHYWIDFELWEPGRAWNSKSC